MLLADTKPLVGLRTSLLTSPQAQQSLREAEGNDHVMTCLMCEGKLTRVLYLHACMRLLAVHET